MTRAVLTGLYLIWGLFACATVPQRSPQADLETVAAHEAFAELQPRLEQFYLDIQPVLQSIQDLYDQPGWQDMRKIIEETPVIPAYVEGAVDEYPSSLPAVSQWSRTWGRDWDELFSRTMRLADRCAILEARRAALRHWLLAAQAKYLKAIILQSAAEQHEEVESLWALMELVEKAQSDLDVYVLDSIGLYQVYREP